VNFCYGNSCTIGRHFDAKGRHGNQNRFERCHLLLIAPVETALKTLITLSTTAQNKPLNFHVLTAISIGDKRF
jgi:hypothetical protein